MLCAHTHTQYVKVQTDIRARLSPLFVVLVEVGISLASLL